MSEAMIEARGLVKRYDGVLALDKVSMQVNRGEVLGFLGPNGAGKSTTMRILTCFIAPSSGVAKVRGHDVFDDTLAVRASLGYLPQRAPLYLEMTVFEYLEFAAKMRNLHHDDFKRRARSVVEVCGLAQSLSKEIRHLSHGYRQRVGLAQALIHDPPILILDEPTSDLDPNEKAEFLNYLKQIGKDRTVLLSTHNLKEVETACARAIIVSRGRVVADGALEDIRAKSGRVRYVLAVQEAGGEQAYRGRSPAPSVNEVETALLNLKGVSKVTELPTDEKAHAFEIHGETDNDLRPDLFRLIADKGWVLLELHRDTQTLEDVFRQLTIGDERRNRQIGATDDRASSRSASEEEEEEEDEDDEDEDEGDDEEKD